MEFNNHGIMFSYIKNKDYYNFNRFYIQEYKTNLFFKKNLILHLVFKFRNQEFSLLKIKMFLLSLNEL
jgi:hypothetical protein